MCDTCKNSGLSAYEMNAMLDIRELKARVEALEAAREEE